MTSLDVALPLDAVAFSAARESATSVVPVDGDREVLSSPPQVKRARVDVVLPQSELKQQQQALGVSFTAAGSTDNSLKRTLQGRVVDKSDLFDKLEKFAKDHAAGYEAMVYPEPKGVSYGDARYAEQSFSGDAILESMRRDLLGFPKLWLPTEVQRKIHEKAFMAEAALIYGKE
jgi:hypothetical protein